MFPKKNRWRRLIAASLHLSMQMAQSLRFRLVAGFTLTALLSVLLAGGLSLARVRWISEEHEIEYLNLYAEMAASRALPLLDNPTENIEPLQALAEEISRDGSLRVRFLDPLGNALADSGSPSAIFFFTLEDPKPINQPSGSLPGNNTERIPSEAEPLSSVHTPIPIIASLSRSTKEKVLLITDRAANKGSVELSEGPDMVSRSLSNTREAVTTAGAAAVLFALLAGWFVGTRLSAPLVNLADTTRQMQAGNLKVRAIPRSRDEVGELSSAFNQMAEELEDSFGQLQTERDSLRRFIADASHELRTPLTSIRMYNELLQGPDGEDAGARNEFLSEVQTQINRLEWLTENLLELSRLDAGIASLTIEFCSIANLLTSAVHLLERKAADKGIQLQVQAPPSNQVICCDQRRLEMALTNLLENAIKFSPPGSLVKVGAEMGYENIRIWVADNGPGIAQEDLPHIFERFYRGRDRAIPGSGLGLAIVKSGIELQGGSVHIDSKPGSGTTVEILLPIRA